MEQTNPYFTEDFALTHERYAEQITGFVSREALKMVENVDSTGFQEFYTT